MPHAPVRRFAFSSREWNENVIPWRSLPIIEAGRGRFPAEHAPLADWREII